jgi:hypothetical protein
MAVVLRDTAGIMHIELTQGDNKDLALTFETVNLADVVVPLDLRTYSAIRLDVKSQKDVNEKPFISFSLGNGLIVGGANFNVLSFSFTDQFMPSPKTFWYYDIKFTNATGTKHLIEGAITIKQVTTK